MLGGLAEAFSTGILDFETEFKNPNFAARARRVVEMMAFGLQASLLVRYSVPADADAFCATRLDRDWGPSE